MPRVISGFTFALSADAREFYGEMRRVNRSGSASEKAFARLQLALRRVRDSAARFVRSMTSVRGVMTALAGGGIIGSVVKRVTDLGASLVEASGRVGLTVEEFQGLQRVFEGDGLAPERFEQAIGRLAAAITGAGQGLTTYTRVFETLGVSFRNSDGSLRGVREVLVDLADAFPRVTSETERLGLAQQIFGTRNAALLTVLNRGGDALERQIEEMVALGVVSNTNANILKDLAQEVTNLANIFQTGLANAVAESAAPVRVLIRDLRDFSVNTLPSLTRAGIAAGTALTRIAENIGVVALGIAAVRLAPLVRAIAVWAAGMATAGTAAAALGTTIAAWAGPVGWIALITAGLFTFREEIRGVIDDMQGLSDGANRVNQMLLGGGETLFDRWRNAARAVANLTRRQEELREEIERLEDTNRRGRNSQALRGLRLELDAIEGALPEARRNLASAREELQQLGDQKAPIEGVAGALEDVADAAARLAGRLDPTSLAEPYIRSAEFQANYNRGIDVGTRALSAQEGVARLAFDVIRNGYREAVDAAVEFGRSLNAAVGSVAAVLFDAGQAETVLDAALIKQRALRSLDRERFILQERLNDAIARGDKELEAQLEGYLEINEQKLEGLELSEGEIAALREQCEEIKKVQDCTEEATGAWSTFKRIGRDALETVLNSLDQLILHTDNLIDGLKRLAVQLAVAAIRSVVLTALGAEERQFGGPVQAGQSYIVGERGPELFQPRVSGNIVPNNALGPAFAPVFNIAAPDETTAAIARNEIEAAFPRMLQLWQAQRNVNDARTRGLR